MKISKHIAFAALVTATAMSSISTSYADAEPSPTPAASIADYKIAVEKNKVDFRLFKINERLYREKVQQINEEFIGAIGKAVGKPKAGAPKTQSQKLDEVKAKRSAGLNAAIARDEAIRALGEPPKPPTPPAKPIKSEKSANRVNR